MSESSPLRLVAITDSLRDGVEGLAGRAAQAARGGATMIQLRLADETPRMLVEIARAIRTAVPDVPLVVNDRADVAMAAGAQGVYLAVDEIAPAVVKRIVPPHFIIGVSVSGEQDIVRSLGADWVGIGPVFGAGGRATGDGALGVERFESLALQCRLPAVAIGGVTAENAAAVMRAGAAGIAVISALFASSDPMQAAAALRSALDASGR